MGIFANGFREGYRLGLALTSGGEYGAACLMQEFRKYPLWRKNCKNQCQESPGKPGEPRRIQERLGEPRRAQESPEETRVSPQSGKIYHSAITPPGSALFDLATMAECATLHIHYQGGRFLNSAAA